MEYFYIDNIAENRSHHYSNDTSQDYNYSNITEDDTGYPFISTTPSVTDVVLWIIICTGLPLTLVAIYSLYSLVRNDHITPIYVINLLISDLIQLCCFIFLVAKSTPTVLYFYLFGEMASVGFMVCVALERYLVIAHPLWYHFSRSVKMSVLVCVVVWLLPFTYVLPLYFGVDFVIRETIFAIFHFLPLPLFIFFLGGTLKALSAASRVSSDEKRRITAILVMVLVIYLLLFLPNIIWSLVEEFSNNDVFSDIAFILLYLSPLADLVLYVFIRKGALYKLVMSLRVCQRDINENSTSV